MTRTRRDHMKYLTLIRSIALLHQYQRQEDGAASRPAPSSTSRSPCDDIALANKITHEVLGRSLDELPPQTRRLLLLIDEMVSGRVRAAEDRAVGLSLLAARRAGLYGAGATRS